MKQNHGDMQDGSLSYSEKITVASILGLFTIITILGFRWFPKHTSTLIISTFPFLQVAELQRLNWGPGPVVTVLRAFIYW